MLCQTLPCWEDEEQTCLTDRLIRHETPPSYQQDRGLVRFSGQVQGIT